MLPDYRKTEAIVSAVPLGLAHGLDVYLKNYPNGCSEQITSGAFCRLMISDEADFGLKRAEVFAQLEKTFDVLRRRQNDQGAFGYWAPEHDNGINFISVYVMHFLIEAKAAGFVPPADVFQSGLRNLQRMVIMEPHNLYEARVLAYAIYLLTREEVITTNYILNLQDYLDKHYAKQWQGDLTGVYLAGAWSMLKKDAIAEKIIGAYRIGGQDPRETCDFYQPLGADSQYVAIIARHFPGLLGRITAEDFEAITGPIGRGDFNTLSAAYAVLALKSYSQHMAQNPPELVILEDRQGKTGNAIGRLWKTIEERRLFRRCSGIAFHCESASQGNGRILPGRRDRVRHESAGEADCGWPGSLSGVRGQIRKVANAAHLGEPLTVRLKIRSLERDGITNVAIVDLLPGGFEVVGSSLHPGTGEAGCDYVDVREDRAVFFTSVGRDVRCITYQIKPCNRGKFTVPPVFAESMYDRAIKSRGLPGKITVSNPE